MKRVGRLAAAGVSAFVCLQLVRPGIPFAPTRAEIQAPPKVRRIIQKDCYSCHSDERRLSWFDEIVPGYWLVRSDVLSAREHLNFSTLGSKPAAAQRATLYEAANMIQLGAMPLPQYVALHPEAKVTPEDLAALKEYLAPWNSGASSVPASALDKTDANLKTNLGAVPAEFDGLPFQADFESWRPISFTDRGDNNTFRVILGNQIAVEAAAAGNISPWPDGTRFAKIAWQQTADSDGHIYPGSFVQVEFMVKDAKLFRKTDGWGWGRWRGLDLKPYGNDSNFVAECTGCHRPVRGNDFVYTLPITQAESVRAEVVNNRAALPGHSLPYQPLGWGVVTMMVDPRAHTIATLFGNDIAMQAVKVGGFRTSGKAFAYPAGSVLALVTWGERDDPHWFGARIPDILRSVEFVEVNAAGKGGGYRCYDGTPLNEHLVGIEVEGERSDFLLNLAPAILP